MTIDSLLKCAKSAYKPFDSNGTERKNLVCETLLAHFLGKNRVFLHTHSDKKIQDILTNQSRDSATESRPIRGAKNLEQGRSSASADFLLESDKRGSPPKSEKAASFWEHNLNEVGGSGCGVQPFLRKEKGESTQDSSTHFTASQALESALLKSISLLNNGYPLEYITKKVSFYSQDFFINCSALIPRTETELLVDKALQLIKAHDIQKIYEIGTGSGIIAIMLCLQNPHIAITATDISPTALKIAQKNIVLKSALDSSLKSRITLVESDLLNGVDFNPKDSLIISNPPYIAEDYKIPRNLTYEPPIALFGGKNGDEILQKIIALDSDFLCCEIGYNQGHLADFLSAYKSVEFYKDYAGFMRGFVASKNIFR